MTSLPSSSPAGRKAFTWGEILITIANLQIKFIINPKPCREIPPGRELAEEPPQSMQWTGRQMVHLSPHQWPRHQEAPGPMIYFSNRFPFHIQWFLNCPPLNYKDERTTSTADPDTNLNVWKNGLEVTELDGRGRLAGPSRSWGGHRYSWSCSRPVRQIFYLLWSFAFKDLQSLRLPY